MQRPPTDGHAPIIISDGFFFYSENKISWPTRDRKRRFTRASFIRTSAARGTERIGWTFHCLTRPVVTRRCPAYENSTPMTPRARPTCRDSLLAPYWAQYLRPINVVSSAGTPRFFGGNNCYSYLYSLCNTFVSLVTRFARRRVRSTNRNIARVSIEAIRKRRA